MREYLTKTQETKTLSPQKEKELWLLYKKQGCRKSRQLLISSYQPLVHREALALSVKNSRNLDLLQEGTIGLIEAVEAFDYARGFLFSTFASYKIRGRILNYLGRERELGWHETNFKEDCFNEEVNRPFADGALEDRLLMQDIQEKMKRLPAKEQAIIQGIFLQDLPAKDIAKNLSISTSYLYKLEKRGIRRLRAFLTCQKNKKSTKIKKS